MQAAAFYEHWNGLVADTWRSVGLEKLPGRGSRWVKRLGDKLLLAHIALNPKYPWSVFAGGDFSFYAYLPRTRPDDPADYSDDFADQLHVFGALDADTMEACTAENRSVYEKLSDLDRTALYRAMADTLDCSPDQARDSGLYQSALEMFAMDLDTPAGALVNPPLHFYDEDDLAQWATWFETALPAMLDDASNSPNYLIGAPADA